ncbi:MAG TPA: hypothetical protein VF033_10670 [Steroidobacteraceae bacterium]|jgi:hypothetical protein
MKSSNDAMKVFGMRMALAVGMTLSALAMAGDINQAYAGWLGREITITNSPVNDQIPVGGKLTFIYDSGDDVVRICTRTAPGQRGPWRMDLAGGCNVSLLFTQGTRYCTIEDVKAGDGEVLSQCHRLRSREVALKPSAKNGVELKDLLVFLLQKEQGGKHNIAILIDTPARVTDGGVIIGSEK